ncbi:hypothetical protein [Kribbella solani]|uniref:Uncharacterized protein n=1 Tax=Kribbella solani TaxID=236067 RepID=A0A841E9U3_9ACTN|nr:hypothetical protein [Kribbella solani]MBB5983998.1 hypothetical protein [Kribbella solani]
MRESLRETMRMVAGVCVFYTLLHLGVISYLVGLLPSQLWSWAF